MIELTELAQKQINESFMPEYKSKATEEEGLGIAIAHHFEWDGIAILKTFASALEDANFHSEGAVVIDWIDKLTRG